MRILLVEDDLESRNYLDTFLRQIGHDVITAENGEQALGAFNANLFDLVLTDIKMPQMSGIEFLRKIKCSTIERYFEVVIFTGHGDMETAIESLRMGVCDYLLKPVDIKVLTNTISRSEENLAARKRNQEIINQFSPKVDVNSLDVSSVQTNTIPGIGPIGCFSKSMREIVHKALKFHEDRTLPVLILGETGTGKEVMARMIHYGSSNSKRPFIDVNCAALSPSLFESELFGYESGAFTGARSVGGKGKIDLANGGTLFLDEIGELSIDLQAKLLRVIQEREFYRVGGLRKVGMDVRLICATNVDIQERVAEGNFRKDLYYRLNVGQFVLPPLRERRDDIIPLAEMLLKEFCEKRSKRLMRIGTQAKATLLSYDWPGNVRELRNLIELIVFTCDDCEISAECLERNSGNLSNQATRANSQCQDWPPAESDSKIKTAIDGLIYEALESNNGNKVRAARSLGISRRTLYRHLERLNLIEKPS